MEPCSERSEVSQVERCLEIVDLKGRLWQELQSGNPDIELIELLCKKGNEDCFCCATDGSTALHIACKNSKLLRHPQLIQKLLNANPAAASTQNEFGFTPLHKAVTVASEEHILSIKILMEANRESLRSQTRDGQSVLHLAVSQPRNPSNVIIEMICEQEPTIAYIADSYGQLPLHKAVAKPRMEIDIIQTLIRANPYAVSLKDSKGY
jgi:ankyrin repeat protein